MGIHSRVLDTRGFLRHFGCVSRSAEELLEFPRLREIVAGSATCAPGRRAILALEPRFDADTLTEEFEWIREAVEYLRAGSELGFGSLADPEVWLAALGVPASVLSAAQLLDAASLGDTSAGVRATFRGDAMKFPRLAECAASISDFRSMTSTIRRSVLPNGEISDNASAALKRIRVSSAQTRDKIQKSLDAILRARGDDAGHDYVTLRNDRFVIPVSASERRAVPGVIHGASATGQTVFVEPLETIDLNNRLVQLCEDEAAEIARILAALTDQLRLERGPLAFAAERIAEFDSVFARARFAREFDCAMPKFISDFAIRLHNARNPVLEASLKPQGRSVVPVTLALGGAADGAGNSGTGGDSLGRVMVISGPNTGGKTVALKTLGLSALAGQSGIPVAADRAELPILDAVLADIGDEQSITADLSTFSAHVLNLKSMLERATERTLVLVDELGTGTAPEEGAALAVALLEEFRRRGSLVLATTHHDRLKSYASTTPGVINAAVEFDEEQLRPTYRLLVGVPGVSSGIEIARRLGLSEEIITRARAGLSPETREVRELIAYLHRSREESDEIARRSRGELESLEAERRELRTEWVERQRRRIAELEKNFADTVKKLEAEVAKLAADIQDRKLRAEIEKSTGRKFGKIDAAARDDANAAVTETLASSQADLGVSPDLVKPLTLDGLTEGTRLRVRGMKQAVILRRVDGRSAEVEAGPMRMKIALEDILGVEGPAPKSAHPVAATRGGISVIAQSTDEPSVEEINVIGCTVEEASARVDKFIDTAALNNQARVRIIHGHGTGALRRGLAEFLRTHPLVAQIHAEAADRGGAAITVVELTA
jgi:DNA mismatch repair protein MutS2